MKINRDPEIQLGFSNHFTVFDPIRYFTPSHPLLGSSPLLLFRSLSHSLITTQQFSHQKCSGVHPRGQKKVFRAPCFGWISRFVCKGGVTHQCPSTRETRINLFQAIQPLPHPPQPILECCATIKFVTWPAKPDRE